MYGGSEQEIQLASVPIWMHLTYQTAFVDEAGRLQTRRDVYNLDSRTLGAIKSTHAIPEPASEPKHEPATAAHAPTAPAHHPHRLARPAPQPQAAPYQSIFSASGTPYAQPRRGAVYR
jgi:hypothetical protein